MSTTYHELVVEGPLPLLRGFVAGFLAAKGLEPTHVLFAHEHCIQCESLAERIAEWVHLHPTLVHLLVPLEIRQELHRAIESAGSPFRFSVKQDRQVVSASFEFRYIAYSQRLADELDALVKRGGEAARLSEDYEPVISIDPGAAGAEAYTATHDFEVRARGSLSGALRPVLDLHRLCDEHTLVDVEPIVLHHADD